jgi:mono/diheme cytochrome c family protein
LYSCARALQVSPLLRFSQLLINNYALFSKHETAGEDALKLQTHLTTIVIVLALAWPITQAIAADADVGKKAYEKNCAGCHGVDGKGNPAVAKTLGEKGLNIVGQETKQKSDEEILKIIAEGAGKMPPSKKLTKDEQKAVLQYSRSLAR